MTDHPMRTDDFMERALADHGSAVLRLAMDQLRNLADAQDATQEVFLRLLKSDTPFEGAEHLRAWLLRVTLNYCRDVQRSAWRKRVDELDDAAEAALPGAPSAEDVAVAQLADHPVWRALEQLPEDLRLLVHLRYVEQLDDERIAAILGVKRTTVRTRLFRARNRIRSILLEDGSVPAEAPGAPIAPQPDAAFPHGPPASP